MIVPIQDIIRYPLFADADTGIYSHAGVTNLSHAQTIFVTFWNVSAALKSQLSH